MKNEWVLLLGANSDIAKAVGRKFAAEGYNLQLASRNTDELNKEVEHLRIKYGIEALAYSFDALDFASHSAFYASLDKKPAGVVVAFGTLGNEQAARSDFNGAKNIIDTNFSGAVSILEIIAADFEQRKWGFIVGISSVAGDRGRQSNYLYGSAKAGFSAYLEGLRHRLFASGISVLTVKPGFVRTKMTADLDLPEKLTATPEEVADRIATAVQKKKKIIYVKPIWKGIMWIIVHLPGFVFYRSRM